MITRCAAALIVAAMCSAGCTAQQTEGGDKAGGDAAPVRLRLGTSELAGTPGGQIAARFAAALERVSGGAVAVDATYDIGAGAPAWDQTAIRTLTSTELDVALVPARAWRSSGVTSLDPLQLPTLVESDEQADRVAASTVATDLLGGLAELGVTGLGLYPEGSRHLTTFDDPAPLTVQTLAGKTVRAPLAGTTWKTIQALGGTPVDLNDFADQVAAGEVQAAESSLALLGNVPTSRTQSMTANVSLYYKFQVLAVRTQVVDDMDGEVRSWLQAAAAEAATSTRADRVTQGEALERACSSGGRVVLAGATGVAALQSVLREVVREATADGDTSRLVDAVRTAAGPAGPATAASCDRPVTRDPASVEPLAGDLPDGIYRVEVTDRMLTAAGMPARDHAENHGVYTYTLKGGRYTWAQTADNQLDGTVAGAGTYEVRGDVVTWAWAPEMGGYAFDLTWSVGADGSLRMTPVGAAPEGDFSPFRLAPLVKIG